MRGTIEHPFRNIKELKEGIKNKEKCTLYTYGTWILPEEIYQEIKSRRITLLGVLQASLQETEKVTIQKQNINIFIPNEINLTLDKHHFLGGMR